MSLAGCKLAMLIMTRSLVVDLEDQGTQEVLAGPITRTCRSLRIMDKSLQEMDNEGIYLSWNLSLALNSFEFVVPLINDNIMVLNLIIL